jgi:plastocyanin
MGTKVKFQPTKTKLKYDAKAGDKINFDLQGYVKHSSILKKKPLEGSKVKGTAKYKSGKHSVTGEVNYRPGKGKGSASATYKYKFKKGGQI